jgi:hypothetical protein
MAKRGRPVTCEICGSLVRTQRRQCPYCEAPLPPRGFWARHAWEIGGAATGIVTANLLLFQALWGVQWRGTYVWSFWAWGGVALAPTLIGGALGAYWGYRVRTGRSKLYDDWDGHW